MWPLVLEEFGMRCQPLDHLLATPQGAKHLLDVVDRNISTTSAITVIDAARVGVLSRLRMA